MIRLKIFGRLAAAAEKPCIIVIRTDQASGSPGGGIGGERRKRCPGGAFA